MNLTESVTKERISDGPLMNLTKSVIENGFGDKPSRTISIYTYNNNFLKTVTIFDIVDGP